jgi:5,10-methenyltetrahydromethanopterin hydrogenase
MSESNCCGCKPKYIAWFVGIAGTFLITYGFIQVMRNYTATPDLTASRAAERAKNLKELHAEENKVLNEYAWQNKDKGFVRVPTARAMELILAEYQNPKEIHAEMVKRVEKLNEPPPKPPEVPSAFE